jgi:hypothetical protein
VTSYPFLSPEWIEAAQALRHEYSGTLPEPTVAARINVVVTEVPHGDADVIRGHIDTSAGQVIIEHDHLDDPELTVTVDYSTAKAAFVTQDPQQVMQAFFSGKILVDGDVSKLMALQAPPPAELEGTAREMAAKIEAFTAPD